MKRPPRIAVLISGRGSNLQSIVDAIATGELDATIAVVISSRADAPGLLRAREAGIDAMCLNPRDYASRDDYDRAIVDMLRMRAVDLVCLAGFMRLVGPPLLDAFPSRILNIHPSLLPAFPGLDAQRQALNYGARISGVTVHLVTSELDGGPIVLQAAVPVRDDDRDMPPALEAHGVQVLKDARARVRIKGEDLELIGIRYWTRRAADIAPLLRGATGTRVLLAHDPRRLFEAAALGFPLVLSGHTHGGQVVLPLLGAVAAQKFPIVAGTGWRDKTTMFVSRGLGTVYVPVRVNCPPEVAVLTLTPAAG